MERDEWERRAEERERTRAIDQERRKKTKQLAELTDSLYDYRVKLNEKVPARLGTPTR